MKLFKLRTIAFSYIEHVDLYCSDKGETLHIHNLPCSLLITQSPKVINSVFKSWLVYFELCCVRRIPDKDQIRDTLASFPIGTKYARSEIWYRIWKTLNFYKLKNNLPLLFGIKRYWFDKLPGGYFLSPQNHWLFYS